VLARSHRTIAAVRQYEMNVNITLVTTKTWPDVGPRRFGRGVVRVPDAVNSGGVEGRASADISNLFRGGSIRMS
jgi:hypothetical protein